MANDVAIELCQKLAQLAPGDLNHVFLTTGGSTAVDTAYRLIQYYQNCRGKPHKKHIIARYNAYHGSTTLTMSIGNKAADRVPEFDYHHDLIHHVSNPNPYRAPDDMDEAEFLDFLVAEFEDKRIAVGADCPNVSRTVVTTSPRGVIHPMIPVSNCRILSRRPR
jgi:adenosylmethionine-8-amino-7-oxononanoate aminotransferase